MGKNLTVVTSDGTVSMIGICQLVYLLILASLVLVAALAINEAIQKIIEKYGIRKDHILGYIIYAVTAVIVVIIVAYTGCRCSPEIVEYINLSPF